MSILTVFYPKFHLIFVRNKEMLKKIKKIKKTFKKVLTNGLTCGIIIPVADKAQNHGSIAQLGEHLPYKQRVIGSSPIVPTMMAR